jgi:hypothetical protein
MRKRKNRVAFITSRRRAASSERILSLSWLSWNDLQNLERTGEQARAMYTDGKDENNALCVKGKSLFKTFNSKHARKKHIYIM